MYPLCPEHLYGSYPCLKSSACLIVEASRRPFITQFRIKDGTGGPPRVALPIRVPCDQQHLLSETTPSLIYSHLGPRSRVTWICFGHLLVLTGPEDDPFSLI